MTLNVVPAAMNCDAMYTVIEMKMITAEMKRMNFLSSS